MDVGSDKPYAGQVLAGKYRIDKVIGQGAMGYVLAAYHLELEERIAIKWVRDAAAVGPQAIDRFLREAKLCAKLQSEHVVRVRDVARTETGAPFIVMELLEGHDLSAVVESEKGITPSLAVDYVIEACEAIAEAHQLGIVHRDLKLQNLFLARRKDGSDLVKVLDFGISKVTSSASLAMTAGTAILGSPLYMSPEQWRSSKDVDARSDIWSLGVVLYELLTGTVPFLAESLPELCMHIMQETPRSMRAVVPAVPERLEQIVLWCLAKSPSERPANVGVFVRALEPFATARSRSSFDRVNRLQPASGEPASPPRPMALSTTNASAPLQARTLHMADSAQMRAMPASAPGAVTGSSVGSATVPNWAAASQEPALAPPRRSKTPTIVGVSALLAVLAVGAFVAERSLRKREITTTAQTSEPSGTVVAPSASASAVHAPPPDAPGAIASSAPPEARDAGASEPLVKPASVSTAPKAKPASKPATAPAAPSYTAQTPAEAPTRNLGGSRR